MGLWWKRLVGFDITIDNFILECIIFGFPGSSQNIKLINYSILYAKKIIYKNKMSGIENIGFLGYLSYLEQHLTMEESICLARHQEKSFNFLTPILDNL